MIALRTDDRDSYGEVSRRVGIDRAYAGRIVRQAASTSTVLAAARALSAKQNRDALLQSCSSRLIEPIEFNY